MTIRLTVSPACFDEIAAQLRALGKLTGTAGEPLDLCYVELKRGTARTRRGTPGLYAMREDGELVRLEGEA